MTRSLPRDASQLSRTTFSRGRGSSRALGASPVPRCDRVSAMVMKCSTSIVLLIRVASPMTANRTTDTLGLA